MTIMDSLTRPLDDATCPSCGYYDVQQRDPCVACDEAWADAPATRADPAAELRVHLRRLASALEAIDATLTALHRSLEDRRV